MRRSWLVLVFVLAFQTVLGGISAADDQWCAADPVIIIDGREYRITTSFARANVPVITSVTHDILLPVNAPGARVLIPANQPVIEEVRFERSAPEWTPGTPLPVRHTVTVHTSGGESFAVHIRSFGSPWSPPGFVATVSNSSYTLTFTLP